MKGITHQIFATTCVAAALLAGWYHQPLIVALPLASAGALVPDIDDPRSKLGRKTGPISELIFQFAGHRKFFHSLPFLFLVTALACWLNSYIPIIPANSWVSFSIGVGSHLLGDMFFGRRGVQLLWPLPAKIRCLPESWKVGGFHEVVFLLCAIAATALLSGALSGA